MDDQDLSVAVCADGGVLREVYKEPGWGQVVVRTVPPGGKTEPHRHPKTSEDWFLLRGQLFVTLEGVGTFRMREGMTSSVTAGRGHMVENGGAEVAVLLWTADRVYDPDTPDKEPWDGI